MASVRLGTSSKGIGFKADTYVADGTSITYSATEPYGSAKAGPGQRGLAVFLGADRTVSTAANGEGVWGKLLEVYDDLRCTVQIGGECELPGGTSVTWTAKQGWPIVGDELVSAEGYIRPVASATADELAVGRHRVIEIAAGDGAWQKVFLDGPTGNE